MARPSTVRGMPAFGCAESFFAVTRAMRSKVSSTAAGPTLQLSPMTSVPHSSRRRAKSSGGVPVGVAPSSRMVI